MNKELALLAIQGIKGKKKSSILLMAILFVSLVFTTITVSITDSLNKTNENYRYDTYGEWKVGIFQGGSNDWKYLEECEVVDEVGTACSYGTILGNTAIGTVDASLIDMGHLSMQSGFFPETPGEIAMEASLLSSLGYNYELNQMIQLDIQIDSETIITKEYRLCGVLKYYSGLWKQESTPLVGAILTQKDAEELTNRPEYQYFLTSSDKMDGFYDYLLKDRADKGKNEWVLTKNTLAYSNIQATENYDLYIGLILVTAIIAIVCVYIVQMQEQIRSIALLRSIGGTKKQLIKILFYETLCLLLPCFILGIPFGLLSLWIIFRLFMQISFTKFYVSLSIVKMAGIIGIWFATIFFCRFWVLWIAMKQPLTGRISLSVKRKKGQKKMENIFTVFLTSTFAVTLLFIILQVLPEVYEKSRMEEQPSYSLSCGAETIREDVQNLFQEIPGVERIVAKGKMIGELSFEGMENNSLALKCIENKNGQQPYLKERVLENGEVETIFFPNGIGVHITSISEKYLEEYFDAFPLEADLEKFLSGEEAIVIFYTEADGMVEMDGEAYTDLGIKSGDKINLTFYSSWEKAEGENIELSTPENIGTFSIEVGSVMKIVWENYMEYIGNRGSYYNVLVSEKFIQKVLNESTPNRTITSGLATGDVYGDTHVNIYTTTNASYLSTDSVVADIARKSEIHMENYREKNAAERIAYIQKILSIISIGVSIMLTVLLIFWDIITLSSRTNLKTYGILRAIGMSKKRILGKILGKGVALSSASVLISLGTYIWYQVNAAKNELEWIWTEYQEKVELYDLLIEKYEYMKLCGLSREMIIMFILFIFLLFCLLFYVGNRRLLEKEPVEMLYKQVERR